MILERLSLHNFGVYWGRQEVDLTPKPGRPVVLIGALNGAGKTTLLDALQLVLYGKHARCAGRGKLAYPEYLRRAINKNASLEEGAAIELTFLYRLEGREERFSIRRTWGGLAPNLNEEIEVRRGERFDPDATSRWQEFVEQFIPNQISDLFFFDGEKIESLADPDRSAELVRVGVHALLGLDLVDDLTRSLTQVERRRKSQLADKEERSHLANVEKAIKELDTRRSALVAKMADIKNREQLGRNRLNELQARFRNVGGELFEKRQEIQETLKRYQEELALIESKMRDTAAGHLPLVLADDLFAEAKALIAADEGTRRDAKFAKVLKERDQTIVQKLRTHRLGRKALTLIAEVLEEDRQSRFPRTTQYTKMPVVLEQLNFASDRQLSDAFFEARAAAKSYKALQEKIAQVERDVAAIPEETKIYSLLVDIKECERGIAKAEAECAFLGDELVRVENDKQKQERTRDAELQRLSEKHAAQEITRRVVAHSARARDILLKFRQAMRHKHVARLETLVTESFQRLLRKHSLVHHISIDPETFSLHIHGHGGGTLSADRLSAGERQLLAVSVLWGLAQASGRQLPAVIDTPLSRLDSQHRACLIRHYFPVASHQIILLSTDKEVEGDYYGELSTLVAREYLIEYDESSRASKIREGYFAPERLAA